MAKRSSTPVHVAQSARTTIAQPRRWISGVTRLRLAKLEVQATGDTLWRQCVVQSDVTIVLDEVVEQKVVMQITQSGSRELKRHERLERRATDETIDVPSGTVIDFQKDVTSDTWCCISNLLIHGRLAQLTIMRTGRVKIHVY